MPILFWFIHLICFLLWLWVIWFFRIPSRTFVFDENKIIAPADGKVVVIEEVFEDEDGILIYAPFCSFGTIQKELESRHLEILSSGFERIPQITKELTEAEIADVGPARGVDHHVVHRAPGNAGQVRVHDE